MQRLVLQLAGPSTDIPGVWCPLPPLLMASASSPDLVTTPSICGIHMFSPIFPNQTILIFVHNQVQMVGSETQNTVYCTGYPQTIVLPCIRLPSSQYT